MEKNRLTTIFNTNSVEYKTIADLCSSLPKATLKQSELQKDGPYPVMNSGRTFYGTYSKSNNTGNAITIASRGEYAGFISYINQSFWAGGLCYPYRSKNESIALTKYIYYALKNSENKIMDALVTRGSIPALNKEDIEKFTIPVPPLPVQEEIVRILDMFTELEAELAQELAHRKQQYAFYRDQLLNFDSAIPMVKLKDIATNLYRGSGIKRDQVTDDGVPCVRYGEIYTTYNIWFDKCVSHTQLSNVDSPKYFEHGDILFAITGENIEDIAKSIAYVGRDKCLAGGDIVVMKHNQNPKYLAYALSTYDAIQQKGKGKVKSKVVHSSVPAIGEITIPLPSLDIQQRIVNVLDNFDAICSDLSIGLPAEISARQKQYEYYRDLLFEYAANGLNYSRAQQSTAEHSRVDEIKLIQYVFGFMNVMLADISINYDNQRKPVTSSHRVVGQYPYYGASGIVDYVNDYIFDGEYLLVSEDGANLLARNTPIAFSISGKNWVNNHAHVLKFSEHTTRKYVEYYLNSIDLSKFISGGAQPKLNQQNLNKIKIPLPQIEEQRRIVNILDRFDKLCNDISEGLPAEIEKRHQQYEYYRDKLLSF